MSSSTFEDSSTEELRTCFALRLTAEQKIPAPQPVNDICGSNHSRYKKRAKALGATSINLGPFIISGDGLGSGFILSNSKLKATCPGRYLVDVDLQVRGLATNMRLEIWRNNKIVPGAVSEINLPQQVDRVEGQPVVGHLVLKAAINVKAGNKIKFRLTNLNEINMTNIVIVRDDMNDPDVNLDISVLPNSFVSFIEC